MHVETLRIPTRSKLGESHHRTQEKNRRPHTRKTPEPTEQQRSRNTPQHAQTVRSLTRMTYKRTSPEKHAKRGSKILKKAFEMGPYVKWIHEDLPDANLKLPQFVLYTSKKTTRTYLQI